MLAEQSVYDLNGELVGAIVKYDNRNPKRLYDLIPADHAAPARLDDGQFTHYPDHPLPPAKANTYEANRQARCWARALQLLELGYSYEANEWFDTYFMIKPGRYTQSYEVCPHTWKCSCDDFRRKGSYCKHTLAVYIWVESCKRNIKAADLVISTSAEHVRHTHRHIAKFVRKVAATLFRQA